MELGACAPRRTDSYAKLLGDPRLRVRFRQQYLPTLFNPNPNPNPNPNLNPNPNPAGRAGRRREDGRRLVARGAAG